jgi:pyridoxal phosphate enzyme (YggS family)
LIKNNYLKINAQIKKACDAWGRSSDDLTLVAVSKNQPFEAIINAYNLGIRDFGESYAQELQDKIKQAKEYKLNNIRWHFIGAIQSNKIKLIAQADIIQSVGSLRHAELLSQMLEQACEIFLQVKLSAAKERSGFSSSELAHAFSICKNLPRLKIIGLMTIAPLEPAYPASHWFKIMHDIRQDLDPSLLLSMGMSDDFLEAIKYQSNILRIGTGIFGPRAKKSL